MGFPLDPIMSSINMGEEFFLFFSKDDMVGQVKLG